MSRCVIDTCPEDAITGAPLCAGHWAHVPVGLKDSIAEARRLKCPLSLSSYTTVAIAVAKAGSNSVRTGVGRAG